MSRWIALPKKSRRKCRELVCKKIKRTIYIVSCFKRARWRLSSRLLRRIPSSRCDEHKQQIDMISAAAAESIGRMVKAAL